MQGTSNVGNVEHAGSQLTPLERLRPFQIATLVLPGTNVQVMDATDAQFEAFLVSQDMAIVDGEISAWSFDDRVRLINFARKLGVDLFGPTNKKSSVEPTQTIQNNSPDRIDPELFEGHADAVQAISDAIGQPTPTQLRDDIDLLILELEKSSEPEQKEFGSE